MVKILESFLKKAFVDNHSRLYFVVNDILALLTIVATIVVVLETVPAFTEYAYFFLIIEWTAVLIFTAEYIARMYISKPSRQYIFSFYGVIDLISILPTFLGLGNLTFLKAARTVRIMRLLRIIRLAKVTRLHGKNLDESLSVFSLNVTIYVALLVIALLIFGTMLYIVESSLGLFTSIPIGMWWAFKVFLGSIPVDAPLSAAGAALYVVARFTGLILLGVLVGVVGNIFKHYFTPPTK